MADRLPFGQLTPAAKPIGAFANPGQGTNTPEPARPQLLDLRLNIQTIQRASEGNVQGFNQAEQLAQAIAPFNRALTGLLTDGVVQLKSSQIEAGYYDQLKEQQARATLGLQQQQEAGASNAAAQIRQLEKQDPGAAALLEENNPWRLIGRRRAIAQDAASHVREVVLGDLTTNQGEVAGYAPGSPQLAQRKIKLTGQILDYYGLSPDNPEVAAYVSPAINRSWDAYTEQQRQIYSRELTRNTADAATAAGLANLHGLVTDGIQLQDGTILRVGQPNFNAAGGYLFTNEINRVLAPLAGQDREAALKQLKENLGLAARDPVLAGIIGEWRLGDPATPYEKRPRWKDSNPVELLRMGNDGLRLVNDQYEQSQKSVTPQLDANWYGANGPGAPGVVFDSEDYQQRVQAWRADALARGYRDPDAYIQERYNQGKTAAESQFSPTGQDQAQIQEWIDSLTPNDLKPENIGSTLAAADALATRVGATSQQRKQWMDDLRKQIKDKEELFNDLPTGASGQINDQVKVDLGRPEIKALDPNGQAGILMVPPGGNISAAMGAAPQKVAKFAADVENLYTRFSMAEIRAWREKHPGVGDLPANVQNVLVSQAITKARQSKEYENIVKEATAGSRPSSTSSTGGTPQGAKPQQQQQQVFTQAQAKQIPPTTAKAYQSQTFMGQQWVRAELNNINNGRPVSGDLFRLAQQAGTSTDRMLLEQLKGWPSLDPNGSVSRVLQQRILKARQGQTISSANYQGATRGLAMVPTSTNAFSPGSWLMNMIMPPAAAATMPTNFTPAYGGGGGFTNPTPAVDFRQNRGGYAGDTGLDIHGPEGSPVVAAFPGRIVYAEKGHSAQMGQSSSSKRYTDQHSVLVELDRPFTYNGKTIRFAWYSHLQGLDPAIAGRNGMRVEAGTRLGQMGIANNVSHLHFGLVGDRNQSVYLTHSEIKALFNQGGGGGGGGGRPATRAGGGLTGMATYYTGSGGRDGVAGGPTANGEIYDPSKMTAAVQWSLRGKYLNKWVKVEDLDTGKQVRVWVNDVGPMGGTRLDVNRTDPRVIDLSPAAFRQLFGSTQRGVGRIRILEG